MDAISPNSELITSQNAAPQNSTNDGKRQEASISAVEFLPGCGELLDDVNEDAVIQTSERRFGVDPRSADLQSAVSQNCILRGANNSTRAKTGYTPCRLQIGDTADCKSALRSY